MVLRLKTAGAEKQRHDEAPEEDDENKSTCALEGITLCDGQIFQEGAAGEAKEQVWREIDKAIFYEGEVFFEESA